MVEHSAVNRVVVGSSPTRGVFLRPHGQAVKTSPFHGGNTGSIPVGVTSFIACYKQLSKPKKDQLEGKQLEEICRCGSIGRAADL